MGKSEYFFRCLPELEHPNLKPAYADHLFTKLETKLKSYKTSGSRNFSPEPLKTFSFTALSIEGDIFSFLNEGSRKHSKIAYQN